MTSDPAAVVVDAENLFFGISKSNPALARECLTALIWWSRRAVAEAPLTPRDGYSKKWDPSYRVLQKVAGGLEFELHHVDDGKNKAELAAIARLQTLTEDGYREFVIGGIDHLLLAHLTTLGAAATLWIVAPGNYPRKHQQHFAGEGKWAGLQVRAIRWLPDLLSDLQLLQRSDHVADPKKATGVSPFSTAGGFWGPLGKAGTPLHSHSWVRAAASQFEKAGYSPDDSSELALTLQTELQRRYGTSLQPVTTGPGRRWWAKTCLASLFGAYLNSEDVLGPVSDFYYAAIEVGSAHVHSALGMADRTQV